jgi:hypothetical protein
VGSQGGRKASPNTFPAICEKFNYPHFPQQFVQLVGNDVEKERAAYRDRRRRVVHTIPA